MKFNLKVVNNIFTLRLLNKLCYKFSVGLCTLFLDAVPRAQKIEGQVRLDYSPAPTQLALLSPICT